MAQNRELTQPRVLIVEDDASLRSLLATALQELSFEVDAASDGLEAAQKIKESVYDILITDLRLPGLGGEEVLRQAKSLYPDLIVMVATGYGDIRNAVNMMKLGASDYIQKPFLKDELIVRIQKALEERKWRWQSRTWNEELPGSNFGDLVGRSAAMGRVKELAAGVAPMRTTVLIHGETGTGKELVARAIHASSPRRYMPLVVIHCGALTETLLESELFGHERGAFTGAQARKKGKFEVADGGTIFLDEIGDISLKTQTDLLRVLQEKEIVRVGGTQPIAVDFRCVAATNRDLAAMVREGTFRPDLYYRLNVFTIHLPPLRERREDVPLLAGHFLEKHSAAMNKPAPRISAPAMDLLLSYAWPGNVRELENAIERALVIGRGAEVQPADFPFQLHPAEPAGGRTLEDMERAHIERVLEETGWNLSRTARILDIDRTTLYHKLRRYGLKRNELAGT